MLKRKLVRRDRLGESIMNLGSKEGNFKYETKEEIAGHIMRSSALPLDDIWISGEDEYPCLAILINGDYACVHYFEEEGITWQSHGNFSEEVIFWAGGEEWKAPADTIVSIESAISCMEDFFDSMKKPKCIEWRKI